MKYKLKPETKAALEAADRTSGTSGNEMHLKHLSAEYYKLLNLAAEMAQTLAAINVSPDNLDKTESQNLIDRTLQIISNHN